VSERNLEVAPAGRPQRSRKWPLIARIRPTSRPALGALALGSVARALDFAAPQLLRRLQLPPPPNLIDWEASVLILDRR